MSFDKVTYIDKRTPISAKNLNDIQNKIIEHDADIADMPERSRNVFWAEYNITTTEEIDKALADKQIVVLKYENRIFYFSSVVSGLTVSGADTYIFRSEDNFGNYRILMSDDHWNPVFTVPKIEPDNDGPRELGIDEISSPGTSDKYSRGDHMHPLPSMHLGIDPTDTLLYLYIWDTAAGSDRKFGNGINIGTGGAGLSDALKYALLRISKNVWYEDEKAAAYAKALHDALFPPANLISIAAVYTQNGDVYDTDELDSLKADLVVTATMTGGTTKTIAAANYFMDGELKVGTRTITVSYGGQTTTFDVLVTRLPNGLVDGTYHAKTADGSASAGTAIIENGAFTGADMVSYRYVYVPLQNPIKLYAGDRIVYSNAVPATGGDATYGPGPIINGDTTLATRSRFYCPWLPQDGVFTMVKDAVATMIRFDTLSYFNGRTFTMSLSVNGEVVF